MGKVRIHIILYILVLPFFGFSQKPTNYIINGDFEKYTCPPFYTTDGTFITDCRNFFTIQYATGWDAPAEQLPIAPACKKYCRAATCYFNANCKAPLDIHYPFSTGKYVSNEFGTQEAHSGKGYAGIDVCLIEYVSGNNFLSSFIQGQLQPLTRGHKYHFSMVVSKADVDFEIVIQSLGVYFSDTPMPVVHNGHPLVGMTPHIVNKSGYLYDVSGWTEISGDYIATGNEKYCFIGAFALDTILVPMRQYRSWGTFCRYFIDDAILLDCDNAQRQDFLGPDTMLCKLQPFKLSAFQPDTGGVSYLWENNSTYDTQYVTKSGLYWAEVSIRGCPPSRDSIYVQMYKTPVVDLGPDTVICLTKGVALAIAPDTMDSAFHYLWNTGDSIPILFVSNTGMYKLTVDNHSCKASDSISIYKYPLKEFSLGPDTAICTDVPKTLDATTFGTQHYHWSTGDTTATITVTKSGLYWAEARNGTCHFRDSVRLTLNPYPKVDLGPPFMDVCDNLNFKLDAGNPGATYQWNVGDTTRLYKVVNSGYYKVDVTQNGCKSADSIDVSVLPAPKFELGPDTTLCEGTPKVLDATNTGSTYLWQDNSTQATYLVTSQGLYKVKVTKGKCVVSDSVEITYTPKPVFSLGNDTSSCFDVPKYFDVSSALADGYVWQDNSTAPTYTATHAGLVWVQVNKDACVLRDSVVLTQLPQALPDLGPDSFFCAGDYFTLNPGANFSSYLWSDNSSNPQLKVNQPGSYWVVVKNNSGCKGKDSIALSVQQLPVVSLGKDTALCEPDLLLNAGIGFNSYLWQDGSTGTKLHVTDYGTYKIKVSGTKGCTNEAQITISNNCPTDLYVPNAFTPNNDGVNDVFMPVALNVKTVHLEIYNRWGQMVYATDDITKGWNGKYLGEYAANDVYVYVATYTNLHGVEFVKTGNVTLLK